MTFKSRTGSFKSIKGSFNTEEKREGDYEFKNSHTKEDKLIVININIYIYIYILYKQSPHVRKYEILLSRAFYAKRIEIFKCHIRDKNKLNIDFLFYLVQCFKTFLIKNKYSLYYLVQCFKTFYSSHIHTKLFAF